MRSSVSTTGAVDGCGKSNEIRLGHVVPRLGHEQRLLAPRSGSNSYCEFERNWKSVYDFFRI
jgi:hypothetical protein